MKLRKRLLEKSRLYVILDKKLLNKFSLKDTVKKLSSSKTDIIQLRDKFANKKTLLKEAAETQRFLNKTNTLFIINDHIDIAKIADCDGLHLGQRDLSLKLARKILGPDKIIGISCHNLKQALKAQNEGADYIGIGPIFKTATKPEYAPIGQEILKKVNKNIKIPYFAIGDINIKNIETVVKKGAKRIAVARAVLKTKNINNAVKNLSQKLPS
ncbi:MAG: thiamine phosphate synthase [Candidatus Omnitrophica bacterium]|nr:thiamine phosphate synthase [Candidatus Omnitrophota bacterium]